MTETKVGRFIPDLSEHEKASIEKAKSQYNFCPVCGKHVSTKGVIFFNERIGKVKLCNKNCRREYVMKLQGENDAKSD